MSNNTVSEKETIVLAMTKILSWVKTQGHKGFCAARHNSYNECGCGFSEIMELFNDNYHRIADEWVKLQKVMSIAHTIEAKAQPQGNDKWKIAPKFMSDLRHTLYES